MTILDNFVKKAVFLIFFLLYICDDGCRLKIFLKGVALFWCNFLGS